MRPELPLNRVWSPQLADIVSACWQQNPGLRPPFSKIEVDMQALRDSLGEAKESPKTPSARLSPLETPSAQTSPDMRPVPLPILPREWSLSDSREGDWLTYDDFVSSADTTTTTLDFEDSPSSTDESYKTAAGGLTPDPTDPKIHIENDFNAVPGNPDSPVQEHHSPEHTRTKPSRESSLFTSPFGTDSYVDDRDDIHYMSGWESPAPTDDRTAAAKNERRYRMLLQHEFHPSRAFSSLHLHCFLLSRVRIFLL